VRIRWRAAGAKAFREQVCAELREGSLPLHVWPEGAQQNQISASWPIGIEARERSALGVRCCPSDAATATAASAGLRRRLAMLTRCVLLPVAV
jgi:hypothetical protein